MFECGFALKILKLPEKIKPLPAFCFSSKRVIYVPLKQFWLSLVDKLSR